MLNVKQLLAKILSTPHIIEQGTDGIWTYRKWSDGTAECWGKSTASTAFNAWGSNYGFAIGHIAYPNGLFIDTPICLGQASVSGANSVSSINADYGIGSKDYTPNIQALRPNKVSGTRTATIVWHAIGRWK